ALISNVLDFARGRLGGGIGLALAPQQPLAPVLNNVAAELRAGHPGRSIHIELDLRDTVVCDSLRISQLFSNLLANAITYGAPDQPFLVRAVTAQNSFELSVANKGDPIPEAAMEYLFH